MPDVSLKNIVIIIKINRYNSTVSNNMKNEMLYVEMIHISYASLNIHNVLHLKYKREYFVTASVCGARED